MKKPRSWIAALFNRDARQKPVDAAPADRTARAEILDAARGFAIVMMIAYHLCYDLNHFGMVNIFMYTPFWARYKVFGLTIFVGVSGMSMALAARRGMRPGPALKRIGLLALCALAITAGSLFIDPDRFIFFGAIHFFALAGLAGLPFLRLLWPNLVIGMLLIALGAFYQSPLFDHPLLQWTGLVSQLPDSGDYFPFLPWFGVFLVGIFTGKILMNEPILFRPIGVPGAGILDALGRHSLVIYVVHQPLLMGTLWLVRTLFLA